MHSGRLIQLSQLRDIGFREGDPIGILARGEPWQNHPAADEYDGYLLEAVGRIGSSGEADAAAFLVWVEAEHMGLKDDLGSRDRAERTVRSIRSYLESLQQ